MEYKPCSLRPQPAILSLVLLPSALGVLPQGDICNHIPTRSQAAACSPLLLGSLLVLPVPQRSAIPLPLRGSGSLCNLFQLVRTHPSAVEVHQGGKAAWSCRLCLIACNSRQIDEPESGND
jgi:hypothetical protein